VRLGESVKAKPVGKYSLDGFEGVFPFYTV